MRLTWLLALLALSCAYPARAQPREGYVTADDGIRLFFKIEGSGPQVLVVVHGGPGGSLESVRPDLERLAKGRTVIYYDQRGNLEQPDIFFSAVDEFLVGGWPEETVDPHAGEPATR